MCIRDRYIGGLGIVEEKTHAVFFVAFHLAGKVFNIEMCIRDSFSSALLLFGLSMSYGSAGTLYFDDLPAHIDGNPLQIMRCV